MNSPAWNEEKNEYLSLVDYNGETMNMQNSRLTAEVIENECNVSIIGLRSYSLLSSSKVMQESSQKIKKTKEANKLVKEALYLILFRITRCHK